MKILNQITGVFLGVELWKTLTYWVALPGCLMATIFCVNGHLEHSKHEKRPEFIPYSYMRIRTKVCVTLKLI